MTGSQPGPRTPRPALRLGRPLRPLLAALAAAAVAAVFGGAAMASTDVYHHMKVRGAGAAGTSSPLTYGGGAVETVPEVYIDYWGTAWSTGFSTGGYSSAQAQTYIGDFYSNVGGSSWANIDTQYCQGVAIGTVNCGSAGTHVTNPTGQLKGVMTHAVSLPKRISQSAIANEALWLMGQTGGYRPNATYFVFTPSGHSMNGFGTQWCAWHSVTSSGGNQVAYAYMPYQPDAGASCGENFVNGTSNGYGNGYFDGFSIVGGHEYAEAVTDPHPTSGSYGWTDASGSENGDKCAWAANSTDITLGAHQYAVQPLWSNATLSCVTGY